MTSWLNNPHFYVAVKQHTECCVVLIQSPGEDVKLEELKDIGFYVTNSDGDGNPKTNEAADLIAQAPFSPDKDVYSVFTLPACHWPYIISPCTFAPGLKGKFELYILTDFDNLEFVELSTKNIQIKADEVVGAGESVQLREIRRRFKPLGPAVVDLVKITEQVDKGVPEFMQWVRLRGLPNADCSSPYLSVTVCHL